MVQEPSSDADVEALSEAPGTARRGLLPVLYPNRDFFLCDLLDYALKDDGSAWKHRSSR